MIKLIATDIDGTLVDSNKKMPENLSEILNKIPNVRFVVASGRQYQGVFDMLGDLSDRVVIIAENGGIIFEDGKEIYSDKMDNDNVYAVLECIRKIKGAYPVLCCDDCAYTDCTDKHFLELADPYYRRLEVVEDILKTISGKSICKLAVFQQSRAEEDCYVKLRDFCEQFKVVLSGDSWVDIMNKSVSKGSAIRFLQNRYDISYYECMAFGDYLNDLEMMNECYFSVAMGNAHEKLKSICRFETETNDENGVIKEILRNIELMK